MFTLIVDLQEMREVGSAFQMFLDMKYFSGETSHNISLSANVQREPWYHNIIKDLIFTPRMLNI